MSKSYGVISSGHGVASDMMALVIHDSLRRTGAGAQETVGDLADELIEALAAVGYAVVPKGPTEAMVNPDGDPSGFDMELFDLCRNDDYAGIWRLLIERSQK